MIAAGSTNELKRELSAFDDKVTRMERSLQQVGIFSRQSLFLLTISMVVYRNRLIVCLCQSASYFSNSKTFNLDIWHDDSTRPYLHVCLIGKGHILIVQSLK